MKKYIDVEEDIDNQIPARIAKKRVEISRICTRSNAIYNCFIYKIMVVCSSIHTVLGLQPKERLLVMQLIYILEHFEVKKRGRNVYTNHEICVIWRVLNTKSCIK
jgi:hypothetical protein